MLRKLPSVSRQDTETADVIVGLTIPTLGTRPEWLENCMKTIATIRGNESNGLDLRLSLVVPTSGVQVARETAAKVFQSQDMPLILEFNKRGLSRAINRGIDELIQEAHVVSWIGDDDVLNPEAFPKLALAVGLTPDVNYAVGSNLIIDERSRVRNILRPSNWVELYASYGRNFLPQPGSVVDSAAWRSVGGLDETLGAAMDLDLFLKLSAHGFGGAYTHNIVAAYRWHSSSISGSKNDWTENGLIQQRYLGPKLKRFVSFLRLVVPLSDRVARRLTHRRFLGAPPSWIEA